MKEAKLALTCPEAKGLSVLPGQLVEPTDRVWIDVDGGARLPGFWKISGRHNDEPGYGPPKNLRLQLTDGVEYAIVEAFGSASELRIVAVDLFYHDKPCIVDKSLSYRRAPKPHMDDEEMEEQAKETIRDLLENNKSGRRMHRKRKLSVPKKLPIEVHNLGRLHV